MILVGGLVYYVLFQITQLSPVAVAYFLFFFLLTVKQKQTNENINENITSIFGGGNKVFFLGL